MMVKISQLVLMALLMNSCAQKQGSSAALAALSGSLKKTHYTVVFQEGQSAEAELVSKWMDQAIDSLSKEFSAFEPQAILSRIEKCEIHLHSKPNSQANEGTATIISSLDSNGRSKAEIHLLAPSAHTGQATTSVGEPKDAVYLRKTLVHEYGTLFLDQIVFHHSGWESFHNAQDWFEQGFEEYLALNHSSEQSRTVTASKYLQQIADDPNRLRLDFGINARDNYGEGFTIIHFIQKKYGREKLHAVLASKEKTFDQAMATTFGSFDSFRSNLEIWLKNDLKSEISIPISRKIITMKSAFALKANDESCPSPKRCIALIVASELPPAQVNPHLIEFFQNPPKQIKLVNDGAVPLTLALDGIYGNNDGVGFTLVIKNSAEIKSGVRYRLVVDDRPSGSHSWNAQSPITVSF